MRVAIVTQELMHNYGGTLQAYAMQEALRRLGHDPVTVDYFPRMPKWYYLLTQVNMLRYYLMRDRKHKFFPYPKKERRAEFAGFMKKHIVLTRPVNKYTVSLLKKCRAEAIVVGSDQVWRFDYTKEHYAEYFFDFAEKWNIKRFAFAASFGVKDWNLGINETSKIKKLASLFDGISTREESGMRLCQEYLACKAIHLLDPAFLLSMDEYRILYGTKKKETNVIAAYILDLDQEKTKAIKQISQVIGKDVTFIGKDPQTKIYQSVIDWIKCIDESNLVVTDSFHGVVFSIIFGKPFVLMINENRGAERFISLSNTFGPFQYFVPGSIFSLKYVNYLNRDKCKQIIDENKLLSTNFISM